ncbi:MAG: hypothetical protein FWG13_05475 [Leptospirales bacterium]|nr:hypothetical protein [Leptospirales bacterium]
MKRHKFPDSLRIAAALIFFLGLGAFLYAQEEVLFDVEEEESKPAKLTNTNVDAEFMYGQYNNISSNFSIIQGFDSFAYQLNADYKRSNDFGGHKNSSFYDNAIELTGQTDLFDAWTFIPLVDVRNESHGMFSNDTYSREEKDRLTIIFKNEYKPTPTRWQFNVGGSQYIHRLVGPNVVEGKFNKFDEELEWEQVFSASQKLALRHYSCQYFYSSAPDDFHIVNELIWSIKLFEYLKLTISPMAIWNRDESWLPGGRVQLDSDSLRMVTLGLSFSHELLPFRPEELYYEQRYIKPESFLPPQKVNKVELNGTFLIQRKSESGFYLKSFKFKTRAAYEDNNNFYNYVQVPSEDVIIPGTVHAESVLSSNESSANFVLYSFVLSLSLGYTYTKYISNEFITYRPMHKLTSSLSLGSDNWNVTWGNNYSGSVYVDATNGDKLSGVLIGSLGLSAKVVESTFLNIKINNLYNAHYSYRDGYPEPGFTIIGGLRILI